MNTRTSSPLAACTLLIASLSNAQVAPGIQWQRSLGGSSSEYANDIKPTDDGGYVIAGYASSIDGDVTNNHGSNDYWIVKLNGVGTLEWQRCLGGNGSDIANSIATTNDGGYIVAGESNSTDGDVTNNHGFTDCWIVKLSALGVIEWERSFGGSSIDKANSIDQTTDGGYIFTGSPLSTDGDLLMTNGAGDYWIVKLDATGVIEWQRSLGGSSIDTPTAIAMTSDGGYIVAGMAGSTDGDITFNHGLYDYWVVKLDNFGTIEWERCYGGSAEESATSISPTTDGGYIISGATTSTDGDITNNHGQHDYWVLKLDATGTIQWQRTYGGTYVDQANSVAQTTDGGYIVAGTSTSTDFDVTGNNGSNDYWIIKLDATGVIQWQGSYGTDSGELANAIAQTSDSGYIVAGRSFSSSNGGWNYWIVKLGSGSDVAVTSIAGSDAFTISPNPCHGSLFVRTDLQHATMVLTDPLGREVMIAQIHTPTFTLDLNHLPRGLYLVTLRSVLANFTQRVVLDK